MKKLMRILAGAILLGTSLHADGQSTLDYDQESSVAASTFGDYLLIQTAPLTQSFVPTLTAVDFVQLVLLDLSFTGSNGATVYVDLWSGSPNINSATLLASSDAVFIPDRFGSSVSGVTNFYFASPIALTHGQTYYLEPVIESGGDPIYVSNP